MQTSQRSASNHLTCPNIALTANAACRVISRLRHPVAGSSHHPAESSSLYCGPPIRFQLLPTPLRSDAVTFSYEALAYLDTDFHRAVCTPSRAHYERAMPSMRRWRNPLALSATESPGRRHGPLVHRLRGTGCFTLKSRPFPSSPSLLPKGERALWVREDAD